MPPGDPPELKRNSIVFWESVNFDGQRGSLHIPLGILGGECVGGRLARRNCYAPAVGRPNRIRLRFECDGCCVRDRIAEVRRLAAADGSGTSVERENIEIVSAERFHGSRIFRPYARCGAFFDFPVFAGTRQKDPSHIRKSHKKSHGPDNEELSKSARDVQFLVLASACNLRVALRIRRRKNCGWRRFRLQILKKQCANW